jgi:hypothetical protein
MGSRFTKYDLEHVTDYVQFEFFCNDLTLEGNPLSHCSVCSSDFPLIDENDLTLRITTAAEYVFLCVTCRKWF